LKSIYRSVRSNHPNSTDLEQIKRVNNFMLNDFALRATVGIPSMRGGDATTESIDRARDAAIKAIDDLFAKINTQDVDKIKKAFKFLLDYIDRLYYQTSNVDVQTIRKQLDELDQMVSKYANDIKLSPPTVSA
jgi:hypothetical protein